MTSEQLIYTIFLVFAGAAAMGTVALFARQSLLVSYIVIGVLLGPTGLGLVDDAELIRQIAHIGVIFLLFLLGLNLHPQKLLKLFGSTLRVTLVSSLLFALIGMGIALVAGLTLLEGIVVGATAMFSSTIIGLKLLPTTQLHHRHKGELIISILLLQDILAILVMLAIRTRGETEQLMANIGMLVLILPLMVGGSLLLARYVVIPLYTRFGAIQEYIFLLTIGWCLGIAELAALLGLSAEIGAFIAGIAIATSPISNFIAESLKPLRDFFLVMFFFALGASFDLVVFAHVWFPALLLTAVLIGAKPLTFCWLLRYGGETERLSREVGVRLGQMSEFSLLIAMLALESDLIGERAMYLILTATIASFVISSYWIMLRYPTPIAVNAKLRRD